MSPKLLERLSTKLVRRRTEERGAYAILFSMLLVLMIALAAISVDIASQVDSKQRLKDTMDAAAHEAALSLASNNKATIEAAANQAALRNGHSGALNFSYWCVVAADEAGAVNVLQIPSTCSPGKGTPNTAVKYPGLVCDGALCFIPCFPELGGVCNTVRIEGARDVDYNFAPAIGYDKGSTGSIVSVACKGPCGTESPNPLDVVIMADRTASMSSDNRTSMKRAILASLQTMNPEMHHVAFGALHKSRTTNFTHKSKYQRPDDPAVPVYENCRQVPLYGKYETRWSWGGSYQVWVPNAAGNACETRNQQKRTEYERLKAEYDASEAEIAKLGKTAGWDGTGDIDGDGYCKTEAVRTNGRSASDTRSEGTWIPVDFNNTFLQEDGSLQNANPLVDGVNCLYESATGEYGTHLAGAMKGAAKHVLSGSKLPGASDRPGQVRKVIIFETDGLPDEIGSAGGNTSLGTTGDVFGGQQFVDGYSSATNGERSCQNFLNVASNAKAAGILVITIGFGDANKAGCRKLSNTTSSGTKVRDVLAKAASNVDGSTPSTARSCDSAGDIALENSDGDYYFCAAEGGELADIFRTAITQLSGAVKFLKMPS